MWGHSQPQGHWHQAGSHSWTATRAGRPGRTHGRHFSCQDLGRKSLRLPLGLGTLGLSLTPSEKADDHIRALPPHPPDDISRAGPLASGPRMVTRLLCSSVLCPAPHVWVLLELDAQTSTMTLVWAYSPAPSLPSSPSLLPSERDSPNPLPPANCPSSSWFFQ